MTEGKKGEKTLGGGGELHDEATRARCEESLYIREELEREGVWALAKEMAKTNVRKSGAIKVVEKMLGEGKQKEEVKLVGLDLNSLRF